MRDRHATTDTPRLARSLRLKQTLRLHAIAVRDFLVNAAYLTPREQFALFLILCLFVLGSVVRYFHLLGMTE